MSAFGRRLRENGSRGTDHGSASVALTPDSSTELYRRVLEVARV